MSERRNKYDQPIGAAVLGWSERPRPSRQVVQGRYCRLESIDVDRHAADLFAAYVDAPDDRDWTYLFAERPKSRTLFRDYLNRLGQSDDPLHYTIVDVRTSKPVGTAALMRIDPINGVIEVGAIAYSPRLKQTCAGTEAMYLLMRLVFGDLGYRRYEWKCDSLNGPSRSAALRYGFTFEGIFRNAVIYKGRNRDTAWFSIIAQEWPRIRTAFDDWLDPANFDSAGQQRRSLSSIRESLAL